jgi:hypothetical protein
MFTSFCLKGINLSIHWKRKSVHIDSPEEVKLLKQGYEPFAVSNQGVKVHYRKSYEEGRGRPKKNEV